MFENVKQSVQDAADTIGERVQERKADMKFDARLKAIERNVAHVDTRLDALGKRFPRQQRRFPVGLVLVAGIGYALYNPRTRARLTDLIGQVSPSARDALNDMLGRAGEAAQDVKDGRDPQAAVKDAAQDIAHTASRHADAVKRDVRDATSEAADRASDTVDRLADRAQDKLNDLKH
ncbi:hypothetical protein [Deinococcus aquiradiocola]|uniref:Uncharacterized protein n=1 Tax=Deinococcus aquiradiocola TaxID=393059 RepID=A0A917P3W3_9DEIO|nr:hypothetical protein [Deinococcus aquiradiocola]GGJ60370.1 hypothetical protein GCM10008939_00160 [Deinococcus aquiradiocola]